MIESPTLDSIARGKWKGLMLPLPPKVYLTGEAAELRARQLVAAAHARALGGDDDAMDQDFAEIAPHLEGDLGGPVTVRSRLIEGRKYKAAARRQERHDEALRVIRMCQLPHWVWVVEFQDRTAREEGRPCVLAEVVFDSTTHDEVPGVELVATGSAMMDVELLDREFLAIDAHHAEFEQTPADAPVETEARRGETTSAQAVRERDEFAGEHPHDHVQDVSEGDPPEEATVADIPDPEQEPEGEFLGLGVTGRRMWRSVIVDPAVEDREYYGL